MNGRALAKEYTEEQKEELSLLFARILYEFRVVLGDAPISDFANRIYLETAQLPWVFYRGNALGILKHLEEAGVYGAFHFFPASRVSLYTRAVFSQRFSEWIRNPDQKPTMEKFLRAWPRSKAQKPTEELISKLNKRCFQMTAC